jgi:hypothetical protein
MFNEDMRFHDVKLVGENDAVLGTIPALSFNVTPTERITLLRPVLTPNPNTADVSVDGQTVKVSFKARVAQHDGAYSVKRHTVTPTVTCQRQSRPHALNAHGEGFDCLLPEPVPA